MVTLLELYRAPGGALKYGQDKFFHSYYLLYDILFEPLQNEKINIFEVGYFQGGSARLWLDYFPKAHVRVIDINHLLADKDNPRLIDCHRFKLDILDSSKLSKEYFEDFIPDIAIDDGSHLLSDQLHFIKVMYEVMKPGGYIIVEDIQEFDKVKPEFDALGIPYRAVDFRNKPSNPEQETYGDDVLIVIKK